MYIIIRYLRLFYQSFLQQYLAVFCKANDWTYLPYAYKIHPSAASDVEKKLNVKNGYV